MQMTIDGKMIVGNYFHLTNLQTEGNTDSDILKNLR